MSGAIAFWTYALAACLFASILLWRLRDRGERRTTLLLGAYFATAAWASICAIQGPGNLLAAPTETLRNLAWIVLLHAMSGDLKSGAPRGIRLVFGAVALVIGVQLAINFLRLGMPLSEALAEDVLATEKLLRITTAAGAMMLVHNVYGLAAPQSRLPIRSAMLGLALTWGYDLNLYTLAYLEPQGATPLFDYRGLFMALIAPLFVVGAGDGGALKLRLSRAATFQSLSLLGICVYLAVMAVLATALRQSSWDWASAVTAALLLAMMMTVAVLVLSQWARAWIKVKLAKHLFEHRYDYRSEWLRFVETLGWVGPNAPPLGERIVKAFADILDCPSGLLLTSDGERSIAVGAAWHWSESLPTAEQLGCAADFWTDAEGHQRILEFEALRRGWASPKDSSLAVPQWMLGWDRLWAGIPLVHNERLIGIVLLGAPEYRRPLDWEDFDLLRTAGRQAASSLAEAQVQEALANAHRFEEFNRRFAFIIHDVKNLVSQLSLLSRNAERHADNPDFRADMVATLKGSVGKLNDLLARLSPRAASQVQQVEHQPLRPVLAAAIAAKRRDHDVRLLGDANLAAAVDGAALEQAVGHLLQNAVDASPADQAVTVRVAAEPGADTIAIAISDHGPGMDSDFVRNGLFEPFVSTKPTGFGIGSYEARSLIQAMGGRIDVASGVGSGTTFTIHLRSTPSVAATAQLLRKRA